MRIVGTFDDARADRTGVVGFVPTMGYLHEGHLALIEAARQGSDTVVVSLFVNPLQFDQASDLARYPRDLDRDAALAESAGADILFAPDVTEMYPTEPLTRVSVGAVTEIMEGRHRPGHFEGVATVVAKLFAGVLPDRAWFGRKDAQQLVVITRMAADLSFPVEVIGHPIVRETDGLALSSRNVFLSDEDRAVALSLSSGLFLAADAAADGERSSDVLTSAVAGTITDAGAEVDYVELASVAEMAPMDILDRPAVLAVAARVGTTRLIDNVWLDPDGTADLGARLDRRSALYG